MADFVINVSKEADRVAVIGQTEAAVHWMEVNGLSPNVLDKSRAVSYVDEKLVEAMREVLSAEGFSVEVKQT